MDVNIALPLTKSESWWSRTAARLNGFWQQGGVSGARRGPIEKSVDCTFHRPWRRDNDPNDVHIGVHPAEQPSRLWSPRRCMGESRWPLRPSLRFSLCKQTNYYGTKGIRLRPCVSGQRHRPVRARFQQQPDAEEPDQIQPDASTAVISSLGMFTPATQTVAISVREMIGRTGSPPIKPA
jgi:hypothetical protein